MTAARDTIFALSSGAGRAAVAVVRISGSKTRHALSALTAAPLPEPRRAALRTILDKDGAPLDRALVLFFPGPASFTGEDVAEFHVHGGRAVIAAVLERLEAIGLSPAEPGAFSRRAFENGKFDLTQAEAIADLVDAETEGQRRQALRQMEGALARLYEGWRRRLLEISALLEAEIDFPDEDLPGGLAERARPLLTSLADALADHLADGARGERVRDGYRIAILGAPNAGKSSLLNALARRDAAIVSDIPGTTRDVVEVRLELAGFPVWLADTAGLRETADAVESEGVRRALARAADADLRIGVVATGEAGPGAELAGALREGDIVVRSKADLGGEGEGLAVSTRTGEGLAALEAALTARVSADLGEAEAPVLTRARHRRAVMEAQAALEQALRVLDSGAELAAEDVRLAARALGRITGRVDVEEVLGEIFSSFCIGK